MPMADRAIVPEVKLVEYLLSSTHPDGRGKARFFLRFGFRAAQWPELATALRQHACEHGVLESMETPFGTRYVVEGPLRSPDGRSPEVRTIWFVELNSGYPRLVTAYPIKRR